MASGSGSPQQSESVREEAVALPRRDLPSFPLRELPLQQVPSFEGVSQAYHPDSVTAQQSPFLMGGREANKIRGREAPTPEGRGQSKLSLRDLRPLQSDPRWLTTTTVGTQF